MIGRTDQANHQYDLSSFYTALQHGNLPSVSFLKAAKYQDGHAGYSDPLDEQTFLVHAINELQSSPDWSSTAIVISYDDSDGLVRPRAGADRQLLGRTGRTAERRRANAATGDARAAGYEDRCGYGPRLPLLVISPCAKHNYVDHSVTDQSSILRFIEDNWGTGRIGDGSFDAKAGRWTTCSTSTMLRSDDAKLFLNETTGEIVGSGWPWRGGHGGHDQGHGSRSRW